MNHFMINFLTMTGQQTWELLAWTMCYFLAAGTAVALAGALLRFLCKRLAPQIRYTMSLVIFATLAALPFGIAIWLSPSMPMAVAPTPIVIDLAHTPITMSPVEEPIEIINIVIAEAQTPDAVPLIVAIARQNDSVIFKRAIEFLPWLWLLGTPITFLLLATGLIGSNRMRRQCTLLTEGPIIKTCERLRTTLAVSRRVGIAINERIATPLLIGIVRPLILLPPAALTGWTPEELEMVLLHELAHVRRWDNLVNFGQRLVESLLFFHPAVWWVSRWVRRDREECCDAVVVAQTEKPQAYAELLVALATPSSLYSPPLAGLALAQHPLAGRIRRILHLEEEKMLITRSTLGLVGFFVVAVLGVVLWQPTTKTIAQQTAPQLFGQKEKATKDTKNTKPLASRGVLASKQPSLFPTLEAQRSADLAYKLLGVELEQLDKEELARVKAMKFAGGLRVTSGKIPQLGPLLHYGDLLVGLHVWPTTSLAEVKKVLNRDDLEDLSPLKFYVIRETTEHDGSFGGGGGGFGAEPKTVDQLVTGRIEVNVDAMKKAQMQQVRTSSSWPSSAQQIQNQSRGRTDRRVLDPRDPRIIPPSSGRYGADPRRQAKQPERSILANAPVKLAQVYDGKTFNQWKTLWRRDLSIDLRVKAVRAFVAFANAGKGKEAVDEIMAIVAEYDWTAIGINGVTDPLKKACTAAFTDRQLPIDVAVEAVIAAKDSKSARVLAFLPYVIEPLSRIDKETNKRLRKVFPEIKLPTIEELRAKWHGLGGGSPAPTK